MDGYKNHRLRLLIGSDCRQFLEQFPLFLRYHNDVQIIGAVAEPAKVPAMGELLHTDILLLNIPALDAKVIEILRRVHAVTPGTKALISSGLLPDEHIAEALKWGARGFLLSPCLWEPCAKMSQWETCVKAIRTLEAGELWIGRKTLARALVHMFCEMDYNREPPPLRSIDHLTARERDIVSWVAKGMTNKELARQLGISDKTVKAHLEHIFTKLKVSRRTQLTQYAQEAENNLPWKSGSNFGNAQGVIAHTAEANQRKKH